MNSKPPSKNEGVSVLLTPKEAARRWKVSISWLAKKRMTGDGPPFIRIGRAIRYSEQAMEKWLKENTCSSTSEYVEVREPDDDSNKEE